MIHTRRIVFALGITAAMASAAAPPPAAAAAAANAAAYAKPSASEPVANNRNSKPKVAVLPAKPAAAATAAPKKTAAAAAAVPSPAAVPAAAAVLSQPMYRRFVHPEARVIAGLDLTGIEKSPLWKLPSVHSQSANWKKKVTEAGLVDLASDIERLILSSPGEGEGKGRVSQDSPFVVAMQGKFKIEKLRKNLLARRAQRFVHRGAEIWTPAKSDTALAIVNAQVLLVGDRKSLRTVLDLAEGDGGEDVGAASAVRRRASELAGLYDAWLVSEASMDDLGANGAPGLPVSAEVLKSIDQVELGFTFRQGLKADISLHGRTPEDTAKLASVLSGFKAMASMAMAGQEKQQPELKAILESLKVGTSDERAVISLAVSKDQFDQAIAARMKPQVATAPRPGTPAEAPAATAPAAVPAPAPLVVRIYNAEGGPREVPLSARR